MNLVSWSGTLWVQRFVKEQSFWLNQIALLQMFKYSQNIFISPANSLNCRPCFMKIDETSIFSVEVIFLSFHLWSTDLNKWKSEEDKLEEYGGCLKTFHFNTLGFCNTTTQHRKIGRVSRTKVSSGVKI